MIIVQIGVTNAQINRNWVRFTQHCKWEWEFPIWFTFKTKPNLTEYTSNRPATTTTTIYSIQIYLFIFLSLSHSAHITKRKCDIVSCRINISTKMTDINWIQVESFFCMKWTVLDWLTLTSLRLLFFLVRW